MMVSMTISMMVMLTKAMAMSMTCRQRSNLSCKHMRSDPRTRASRQGNPSGNYIVVQGPTRQHALASSLTEATVLWRPAGGHDCETLSLLDGGGFEGSLRCP